jgi:transcriptional regulator with XRE-family HTH domain
LEQNNLAIRVVDLREKANMNQVELAKKMGFDKSTMSKIENGTRKVSSDELRKLSKIFNVSADYLLGNENESSEKTADLADKETIFTYEGKEIPPEDLEYMKRILLGGQHK